MTSTTTSRGQRAPAVRDAGRATVRRARLGALVLAGACALWPGLATDLRAQTVSPDFYITNGQVTAEVLRGNTLYVGGSFSFVGPVTGSGVPIDPGTGAPAAGFPRVNGTVVAAVPDGSGGWYIGGQFTAVGAAARTNLAHILADQSVSAWNPGASAIVRTLLLRSGVLYVGGDFLTLGGISRNRIGAVDATTGTTTSWNPNANSSVRAFVETATHVIVGGQFTTIGGQARNRIARLNFTTGAADATWNPNANSSVFAMAYDSGANLLYVGGQFTTIGGLPRNRAAAVDVATGGTTTWDPNSNNQVLALVVNGGTVYAGGQFSSIGGQTRNRLAALSTSTGLATSWNPNAGNLVNTLALSGTDLYAGGDFLTMGGQSRSRIAAVDVNTGVPTSWNPSAFSTVTVISVAGGQVFVGGSFNGIGGTARNNLAGFDITTGQVTGWNPDANNQVQALASAPNAIYVGGNFTQVGGQIRNNIAALDVTNGLATPWDPNSDGQVSALAYAGERIYAGGLFTNIGGQPRSNLASLATDDGRALAFVANTDDQVFVVDASTPVIYAGGNFTDVNGTTRNFVAAVDSASGAVTSWNPDPTGTVRSITPTCDRIYLGGFFTSVGPQARNRLATVNLTTGAALPWNPDANGPVFALTYAQGSVYVGGVLSMVGGQTRNRIASIDPQTGAVTAWNPNSNGTVRAIVARGSEVYLGGAFSSIMGTPSGNIAAVSSDPAAACPTITLTAPPLPAGVTGTAYSKSIVASGGTASYCYSLSAGALPAGLTLSSAGLISGTPSAAGIAVFSVTATDQRGCTGTASYTISITAAPAANTVAASGAGLCLNPAQACVSVPFNLVRGDAIGLRAVSVTLQLETAKLQLCAPGSPAANFHLGTWGASFNNRSLQVTSLGSGKYTVDVVLLGGPCGATTGGSVFSVDVAAVGPTGSGSLTVVSVVARDCANGPVAVAPGPVGSVAISSNAITLSPASLPNGAPGTPYSQSITASGGTAPYTFDVVTGSLPPGLSLSSAGLLSGTPTTGGTFNFTVRASEAGGCYGTRAYSIAINCAVVAVSPAFLPDGAVGNAYSATLFASNTIPPATFTVTAGALPAGLTLATNGALTGTPTTAGPFMFTVSAVDAAGCTGSRDYLVDIFATSPNSTVAASATGLAISSANPCVQVPVVYTRGESTPVRALSVSLQIDPAKLALCSITDSSFALGSFFDGFTNTHLVVTDEGSGAYTVDMVLMGMPCGITTGGTLFTIKLAAAGPDGMAAITVTRVKSRDCDNVAIPVLAGAPDSLRIQMTDITLAPPTLPNGLVGTPYSQAITAQSGVAPFTFVVASGSLPAGLTLSSSGLLSGTPTTTGGSSFTVAVTDVGGVPGSRAYTLSVSCPPIAISPSTLPDGQVGSPYSQTLSVTGGTAPHTFTISAGALPDGLSLAATGELTGTPTTTGAAVFTVRATDSFGCSGEETYALPVFTDPTISKVLAVTTGLCLSTTQTCVNVPFLYQRGDSVPAGAAHVTFQLDPRFALCTPGNPSASIHAGSWLASYTNKTLQVIDHGSGSYTVDQALLGLPCGPTTGGVLFTVDVAAVGGDGAGDITVTDVRIRDCSNTPLPGQPGPPAQLIVSTAAPPKISNLVSSQVLTGNAVGGSLTRIAVTWTAPAPGTVSLYRASFGSYPEYDDTGGTLPDSTLAPNAPWTLVSANATSGILDVPPGRGFFHYVAFLTDSCGNRSLVSNVTKGSLDYHLGDVSNGLVRGQGDNRVRLEDVSLLGAHYGISGGQLVADTVAYLDVGPTVNGLVTGRPSTDNLIDFEDLMIFASNFQVVAGPQAVGVGPAAGGSGGSGEAFELEAPTLVTQGEEFDAVLKLAAGGAMQGFSAQLAWEPGAVQPIGVTGAGLLESQGGVVFSPRPGAADAALLGIRGVGITGQGAVAKFTFRALRDGDARVRIKSIDARDARNARLRPGDLSQSLTTAIPTHTLMLAPSPNPAQGEAHFAFALAEHGDVDLSIYAVDGRRVRSLARGSRDPGTYRITWRGDDDAGREVSPGVYWARLNVAGRTWNRRLVFLR